jgi:biotin transport system substrate-specific component
MKMPSDRSAFRAALAALWCAVIAAGAYVAIPFVPVPLVLANFFAVLGGLLFGPAIGGTAVLLYLALGALGLPVFAGGKAGFAHFASPTGGFLVGYLAGAVVAGLVVGLVARLAGGPAAQRGRRSLLAVSLGGLAAMAAMYAIGLPWFQAALSSKVPDLWAAVVFMAPYMVADLVKVAAAAALARAVAPVVGRYLGSA